ncbi:MAG: hypothetical protein Tsb002_05450 [Wenzhouxiangellaceae bacterium]
MNRNTTNTEGTVDINTLNRETVVEYRLVDKYLRGELDEESREAFEIYYLDCPETLEELEATRAMMDGMKSVGASAFNLPQRPSAAAWPRFLMPLAGATAMVVVAAPSVLLYSAYQENANLLSSLEYYSQPYSNVPVLTMDHRRSLSNTQSHEFTVDASFQGPFATVQVEPVYIKNGVYRVDVLDDAGNEIRSYPDLQTNSKGYLTFNLPLASDNMKQYRVLITPLDASESVTHIFTVNRQ